MAISKITIPNIHPFKESPGKGFFGDLYFFIIAKIIILSSTHLKSSPQKTNKLNKLD